MSINYYANNPSYYRNHQYAHQYNLPDSAMNNRSIPQYSTEMPQGNNAFLPSHKKHFQRVGYRSIISQEQLINHQTQEESNSPAINKDYYRNLSIEDIQGASTNTLISQALKNRIKAKEHYLRRQKQQQMQEQNNINIRMSQDFQMQHEALKRFKTNNREENYHNKSRPIKTQANQPPSNKISLFKKEIEQAERDIVELQRKLGAAKQSFDPQNINKQAQIPNKVENQQQSNPYKLVLPKINNTLEQNPDSRRNNDNKQINQIKKRSLTQPNQNDIYPASDQIKQYRDHQDMVSQSRLRRMEIRKLNPTYLSYGTYASNNSAKKVYL